MSDSVKSLVTELANRGPHRVLRGDLAFAGQPGVVYAPAEGFGLPAIAFGHGWMANVHNYRALLEHIASWGIVVTAPNSERGPVPSHLGLATDLLTSLDVSTGVRLGIGDISVDPARLGLAGHGMGAGAAVIAASQRRDIGAVVALFPSHTAPAAEDYAAKISAPALIVGGQTDIDAVDSNATDLAKAWGGDAVLRSIDKASSAGLTEGRKLITALAVGKSDPKTQKTARALLTGFLLATVGKEKRYSAFAEADASIPKTQIVDPRAEKEPPKKKSGAAQISQLLGR